MKIYQDPSGSCGMSLHDGVIAPRGPTACVALTYMEHGSMYQYRGGQCRKSTKGQGDLQCLSFNVFSHSSMLVLDTRVVQLTRSAGSPSSRSLWSSCSCFTNHKPDQEYWHNQDMPLEIHTEYHSALKSHLGNVNLNHNEIPLYTSQNKLSKKKKTNSKFLSPKRNEILTPDTTWKNLENIIPNERSQTQKDKYCMIPLE